MLADSRDCVHKRERHILVRVFAALDEEVACAEQVALDLRCDPQGEIVLDCTPVLLLSADVQGPMYKDGAAWHRIGGRCIRAPLPCPFLPAAAWLGFVLSPVGRGQGASTPSGSQ